MLAILCRILAEGEGVGPTQRANVNVGATNKIFFGIHSKAQEN